MKCKHCRTTLRATGAGKFACPECGKKYGRDKKEESDGS